MKNKKLLYVLLPATVVIWILIFVKVFNGIKSAEELFIPGSQISYSDTGMFPSDTIKLIASYRDPFLPANTSIKQVNNASEKKIPDKRAFRPRRKEQPGNKLTWPEICYSGIIHNNRKDNNTALVIIRQGNYLVNAGDSIGELLFTGVYNDSIRIKYKSEERTINRQK